MSATTDIQPFATSGGANVITQSAYLALTSLVANGFSSGIAQSNQVNKVLRQSSFMAAGLANWMVSLGVSVPDDGNLTNLVAEINTALTSLISSQVGEFVHDTGTANALVVALVPPITSYTDGLNIRILVAHDITGSSTLNAGGGAVALTRNDGSPTQSGDAPAGSVLSVTYVAAATKFEISGLVPSQLSGFIKTVKTKQISASATHTPSTGMVYSIVRQVGGGAGGNGTGPGGGGEYAEGVFSASDIGGSIAVTIGAGGGSNTNGGTTSFGALMTALGGSVAGVGTSTVNASMTQGGLGGTGGTGGTFRRPGSPGGISAQARFNFILGFSGNGGDSAMGVGGQGAIGAADSGNVSATNGLGFGGGGGGAFEQGGAGGSGSGGAVWIIEFCSQ